MKTVLLFFALILIHLSAYCQAPSITGFSPHCGPVGTLVTIRGINLNSPTAFTIAGVSAILVSGNNDSVVGMVMPSAVTGNISIYTSAGSATADDSFIVTFTGYPNTQQGSKLSTSTAVNALQGYSVALSADGRTALLGEYSDTGAACIFTRTDNTWSRQSTLLIGAAADQLPGQGSSLALSADGNTAMIGIPNYNNNSGAVWVFRRSGNTWFRQGSMLIGADTAGAKYQGSAVALSADGNTAIVGGYIENSGSGAVWIFTRADTIWAQQGPKLVGRDEVGSQWAIGIGYSVALSADGHTAIVGRSEDNRDTGAAWIFVRRGATWSQQGSKLVGSDAVLSPQQGYSVALSADGNTALIGGFSDNNNRGAVWVFTRADSVWSQQGSKLVGTGSEGTTVYQGTSVAISADGNTAIIGANWDNNARGAAWVFTRDDGHWKQEGNKLVGTDAVGTAFQGHSVAISADGYTAMVGGPIDNSQTGAAWVFAYDSIKAANENSALEKVINLYPNPNKGFFTLQTFEHINDDYVISDIMGRVITRETIKSDVQTITLTDVADGIYTVIVKGAFPLRFVIVR